MFVTARARLKSEGDLEGSMGSDDDSSDLTPSQEDQMGARTFKNRTGNLPGDVKISTPLLSCSKKNLAKFKCQVEVLAGTQCRRS